MKAKSPGRLSQEHLEIDVLVALLDGVTPSWKSRDQTQQDQEKAFWDLQPKYRQRVGSVHSTALPPRMCSLGAKILGSV